MGVIVVFFGAFKKNLLSSVIFLVHLKKNATHSFNDVVKKNISAKNIFKSAAFIKNLCVKKKNCV